MSQTDETYREDLQEKGTENAHYAGGFSNAAPAPMNTTDGGRDARIALRKARIEAARVSRFRPSDNEGIVSLN